MITKQQIYDKVKAHAKAQPRKAQNYEGYCKYRTISGNKCFIGCLIPDELHEPRMDGQVGMTPRELINNYPALVEHIGDDPGFLWGLQSIHDSYPVSSWPQKLSRLAETYNLKP